MSKKTKIEKWLKKRSDRDAAVSTALAQAQASAPEPENLSFSAVAFVGLDGQGPVLRLERSTLSVIEAIALRDWITATFETETD